MAKLANMKVNIKLKNKLYNNIVYKFEFFRGC